MLHFSKLKVAVILGIILLGCIFATPNLIPQSTLDRLPGWLPKSKVTLGLDLQGGSHLLYEVATNQLIQDRLSNIVDDIREKFTKGQSRIGYVDLGVVNGEVRVKLRTPADVEIGRPLLKQIVGDMQLDIAADGQVTAKYSEAQLKQIKANAINQSIEILRRRIDETGTKEPTIVRQGDDRIVIQLPGVKDPQRIKDILIKTAKMTFRMVDENAVLSGQVPSTSEMLTVVDPRSDGASQLPVQKKVMVSGENLTDAQQSFEQGGRAAVSFKFDSIGGTKFGRATAENVGRRFAIVLDGKIISAPVIKDAILGGSGIITGNFTPQSANDLALLLRAGALPTDLTVIEERTVGADLGADSIHAGAVACVIAIVLIVVAMLVLYGLFGVFANIALLLNAILILGALSLLGATLTFPGIAGMVLTLGMAVDANVLILERVREEMRNGRSAVTAMETGYREAQATILDANITHLISTLFLFQFGSGPIKGFAITLIIGIVTSVFTAVVVSRLMTAVWLRRARPKVLPL